MSLASSRATAWVSWAAVIVCSVGGIGCSDEGNEGSAGSATIGAAGGTLSTAGGELTVDVPAGALTAETTLTAEPATGVPADPAPIPGTAYRLGPDGTTFATPVTLTMRYDPGQLMAGSDPGSQLSIYKAVDGTWQKVPGATVDTAAHTVSAAIESFSDYALILALNVGKTFKGAVGEAIDTGFYTLTVHGVTYENSYTSTMSSQVDAPSGTVFLTVDVEITNTVVSEPLGTFRDEKAGDPATQADFWDNRVMVVFTTADKPVAARVGIDTLHPEVLARFVDPGKTERGKVLFPVPLDTNGWTLRYTGLSARDHRLLEIPTLPMVEVDLGL